MVTIDTMPVPTPMPAGPAFHRYGGQLRRLHDALCNPLEQETGIVLLGDSVTWGSGLPDNACDWPRAHALADPRDFFHTASWANQFKRALGRDYFGGAAPALSNWPASPSGESIAEFTHDIALYPGLAPFSSVAGDGAAVQEAACAAARHGYLLQFIDSGASAPASLRFRFTGSAFTLVFSSTAQHAPMDYELVVAQVSQGVFSTLDGTRAGLTRTHRFAYVRDQEIELRARRTAPAGMQYLELESVEIGKTCRIVNQGIVGSNAKICLERHAALGAEDNFAVVLFGTNDRSSIFEKYRQPNSANNFARNMQSLIDTLQRQAAVILMAGPPVRDETRPKYAFSMLDVRNALTGLARAAGIDLIDHYAMQQGLPLHAILADGLHPNRLGHDLMARNLLDALRTA